MLRMFHCLCTIPIHDIMLPNMHTKGHPNLFTKPPAIGPEMNATPVDKEPTQETVPLLES